MIRRALNILNSNSFFLFGGRGTGKTTLLDHTDFLNGCLKVNLLNPALHAELEANPSLLEAMVLGRGPTEWVVIDEVQKVPALLDLVHLLIERNKVKFALTGSSARKLRRGAANMLAGRAFVFKLYPLLADELADQFNIDDALAWGTLPTVWNTTDSLTRSLYLQAYAETYLREEIIAEQIIRNLPPFRRFLNVAAQMSGKIINYAKVAADCTTDPSNVKNYFQILDDTLLGFFLEPFHHSVRKRQSQNPKFYFNDTGVARALAGHLDLPLRASTSLYGDTFEAFIISQIRSHLEYTLKQYQISFLRTKDGAEIDLIVERAGRSTLLIEVKSSQTLRAEDFRNLNKFASDIPDSKAFCLYGGEQTLTIDRTTCLNWRMGIKKIIEEE